jgi:phosphatidylserine/phosphatidylglycerophosphate/cardiolipin synthase-like enzyme
MAKRKRSTPDQAVIIRMVLIFLALFLVMVLVFGFWGAIYQVAESLGIELPATQAGPRPTVQPSDGAYYTIYFTNPVIPFDDVTSGGIEDNLIELINGAQSTIDLAVFEFDLQNVDDALIAAHQRGVRVRMVYDDEHTEEDPQMEEMLDAGIPGTPDERSAFMHNKFFVIDGQTVWLGTWNVTINDTYKNNNVGLVIRSPQLAQNYTAEFEEMFNGQFGPDSPANTPNPTFTLSGVQVESYFAPEDDVMPRLVDLVNSAQQTIHFMAFSFTDDDLPRRDRLAPMRARLWVLRAARRQHRVFVVPSPTERGFPEPHYPARRKSQHVPFQSDYCR